MDGNGRWAKKKRMQPRVFGHKAGMEALRSDDCRKKYGVQVLTVYAFSTENWTRPEDEVKFIMHLPVEFLWSFRPRGASQQCQDSNDPVIPRNSQRNLRGFGKSRSNDPSQYRFDPEFSLNYGGRAEITQAVKQIAQEVLDAKFSPEDITEETIADSLYTESFATCPKGSGFDYPYQRRRSVWVISFLGRLLIVSCISQMWCGQILERKHSWSAIVEYSHRHGDLVVFRRRWWRKIYKNVWFFGGIALLFSFRQ